MKSILYTLLACVLLLSTMGVSVSKHYCQEKVAGISVFGHPKSCCQGKSKMPPGCCRDETAFLQLDDDFFGANFEMAKPMFGVFPLRTIATVPRYAEPVQLLTAFLNHKPPILHPALHIWVQNFRI